MSVRELAVIVPLAIGTAGCDFWFGEDVSEDNRTTFGNAMRRCLAQVDPPIPAECWESAIDQELDRFDLVGRHTDGEIATIAQFYCDRWRRAVDEAIRQSGTGESKPPDVAYTEMCVRILAARRRQDPPPPDGARRFGPLAAPALDDSVPCGEADGALTICAAPAFPAGDVVEAAMVMDALIPLADPVQRHQFGFVFDADGDPANNYQAPPQFPYDFFQNTDRWYELTYQPLAGWKLEAKDARGGTITVAPTAARATIRGNALFLYVPASEMSATCPPYRMTAFTHQGDFGLMGGPWSADTEPTVDKPLETTCTTL